MKVKMRQIVEAVPSMNKLMMADLPLKTAHRLALLTDTLNPHLRFFSQKQSALEGKEEADRKAQLEELLDLPVEVKAGAVEISLEEDVRLAATDVNALKPFIRFVGEGKK